MNTKTVSTLDFNNFTESFLALTIFFNLFIYFLFSSRNDKLTKEKMEIEKKFETFQREVKHTSKANTAKEIRVLKKVVQNLEVRCRVPGLMLTITIIV